MGTHTDVITGQPQKYNKIVEWNLKLNHLFRHKMWILPSTTNEKFPKLMHEKAPESAHGQFLSERVKKKIIIK